FIITKVLTDNGKEFTDRFIANGERKPTGQHPFDQVCQAEGQACLRPRDRFWDIPVPKIDSAFDNLLVPQPSWSPSTTQQLRKLVAAPYLAPNDWTPRSEAYFVFPLAQGTPGKQCGLAATGDYQPSLRSPWLAAIEHRLIKPKHPQTNGMVERFNGRISEILATTHFDASRDLQ
uniref:integrase core domain-containing protein n=1 Tax=Thiolapillus sp. TaxID=2017437 RepID=UPI003AF940F8